MANLRGLKSLTLLAVVPVILLVSDYCSYGALGTPVGALHASCASLIGNHRVKAYGLPEPTFPTYRKLMRNRYDIGIDHIAGCIVSRWQIAYVNGYNAVSTPLIKRRFGNDVFQKGYEEAKRLDQAALKSGQPPLLTGAETTGGN